MRRLLFVIAVVIAACGGVCAAALADCDARVDASSVLFVTDREPLASQQLFSGERGKTRARVPIITYGVVSAPVTRATMRVCSSQRAFLSAVRKRFPSVFARSAMIYVHGYYRSFKQGAETALLLQNSVKFRGPFIFYSWPSRQTSRLGYLNDEANNDWSQPHYLDLIALLQRTYPQIGISLASHSMGAHLATAGLAHLRYSGCATCLGRSVFFAPDIDSDTLHDELAASGFCAPTRTASAATASLVTVYVSNKDVALRQSQKLHGHQRGGQAGSDMILCGGVDTIDVSYLRGSDRYAHTYQVYPEVVSDVAAIFASRSPAQRGLQVHTRGRAVYYELHAPKK